jgi:protein phosphatase
VKYQIYGATDVGKKRDLNEDQFLTLEKEGLMVVCDGMGGHAAGEVASNLASETIGAIFRTDMDRIKPVLSEMDDSLPETAQKLITAVRLANRRIYNMALENTSQKGMGTTVVSLAITPDGHICIAHVGDSRAYRIRNDEIIPMTVDHSFVQELLQDKEISEEEAKDFGAKNVITRALGTKFAVKVDIRVEPIVEGDQYLLCSDGLTGQVEDEEIRKTLSEADGDLKLASERLIQQANDTGGPDNITVALLKATELPPERASQTESLTQTLPEETSILQEAEDEFLKSLFDKKKKKRGSKILPIIVFAGILVLGAAGLQLLRPSPEIANSPAPTSSSIAHLEIQTTPEGATIFLDGNQYPEKTPAIIAGLAVGTSHDLRVELDGYLAESISGVEITSVGIQKVIELNPEAVLTITYWDKKYDKALLLINGDSVGELLQLKGTSYPLSSGKHTFKIVDRKGKVLFLKKNQSISRGKKVAIVPDEQNPELRFSIE